MLSVLRQPVPRQDSALIIDVSIKLARLIELDSCAVKVRCRFLQSHLLSYIRREDSPDRLWVINVNFVQGTVFTLLRLKNEVLSDDFLGLPKLDGRLSTCRRCLCFILNWVILSRCHH